MSRQTTLAVLLRQHTSIVIEVEAGGTGEALGILPGDRILEVQGWRVRSSADIRRILDTVAENASLTVQVKRAGAYAILGPITLTELPSAPPPAPSLPADQAGTEQRSPATMKSNQEPANEYRVTATPNSKVLLVTSESIPGYQITDVQGIVSCVRAVPPRGLSAKARVESAVESAMQGLRESAQAVGANGVIAVRVTQGTDESASVPSMSSPQTVVVTGTAVVAVAATIPLD